MSSLSSTSAAQHARRNWTISQPLSANRASATMGSIRRSARIRNVPAYAEFEDGEDMLQELVPRKKIRKRNAKTKPDPIFPFLKLPAEIRNMIYRYLVVHCRNPEKAIIDAKELIDNERKRGIAERLRLQMIANRAFFGQPRHKQKKRSAPEPLVYINILQVCRQINEEAIGVMYTYNQFSVHLKDLRDFASGPVPEFHIHFEFWRITDLRLRLTLVDTHRMNFYVEWEKIFVWFPSLSRLQLILTFKSADLHFAESKLKDWDNADRIYKQFFKSLMRAIPVAHTMESGVRVDGVTKLVFGVEDTEGWLYRSDGYSRYQVFQLLVRSNVLEDMYKEYAHHVGEDTVPATAKSCEPLRVHFPGTL